MSVVDLAKHSDELTEAWKEVVEDKSPTNWALFGYEKQSNSLTVVEKGEGGLEELVDELNSSKIMYAFCRVTDPNTSLTKFVLVNWQGEGAPLSRKGSCANHFHDITIFFRGAHITINARTEDDMDPASILDKVSKSTGSKFNFQDRSSPTENLTPVGSVYKRIQPAKEYNSKEREKFWMKEQEEEKRRVQTESLKREAERSKVEQECREREMKEAALREEKVKERNKSISEVREAEHNAENTARNVKFEKMQWERQLKDNAKEDIERKTRSESLRRERSQEAQALISKRTINARAIFEQNSSAGQMSSFQNVPQAASANIVGGGSVGGSSEGNPSPSTSPSPFLPSTTTTTTLLENDNIYEDTSKMSSSLISPTNNYCGDFTNHGKIRHNSGAVGAVVKNGETPPERIERSNLTFTLNTDENNLDQGNDVPSPAPPERPLPGENSTRNAQKKINNENGQQQQINQERSYESQFSYTRNLLREGLPARQDSEVENTEDEEEEDEQNWEEPTLEAPPDVRDPLAEMLVEQQQSNTPPSSSSSLSSHHRGSSQQQQQSPRVVSSASPSTTTTSGEGLRARALYDYQAADETEISFDPDDLITHIEQIDEGWWQGMGPDGSYGLFPANYVELVD